MSRVEIDKAEFSVTFVRRLVDSWIPQDPTPTTSTHLFPTPSQQKELVDALYTNSKKKDVIAQKKLLAIKQQVELSVLAKQEREDLRLMQQKDGVGNAGKKKRGNVLDEYLSKRKKK